MARTSSPVRIRWPGTPFASPRAYSSRTVAISSSENARTSEPLFRYGTSNWAHSTCAISQPRTFSRAIFVPGSGSYPAWIMALLARVAPRATSFSLSSTTTFS